MASLALAKLWAVGNLEGGGSASPKGCARPAWSPERLIKGNQAGEFHGKDRGGWNLAGWMTGLSSADMV